MIELHIVAYLRKQLDNAEIRFITISKPLKGAKTQLITALENFDSLSPYNHIDNALQRLQNSIEITGIERYPIQPDSCTYFHLLTNAVISSTIMVKKAAAIPETVENFSKTNHLSQKTLNSKFITATVRRKKTIHRPTLMQVPKNLLSLKNSENSRLGIHGIRLMNRDNLAIFMNSKSIEAKSGELIRITCIIQADSEDLDVKWYHGEEELPNGGRFRALSAGFRHCLEIFDCSTADQGEITCTVINNVTIASDTVILNIREEDIAGEEPCFTKPLTATEINGKLVLKCAVTGYPIPYIIFHRRSRRIHTDRKCTIEREDEQWTLTLNNCSVDDEGRYTAVARNRVGRTLSCYRVVLNNKDPETYIADV